MKKIKQWQYLLFIFLVAPLLMDAQPFNNTYSFQGTIPVSYQQSTHTCGIQITNGLVIEGGTVSNPDTAVAQNVVEIGTVSPVAGLMPIAFTYGTEFGEALEAVDLIESSGTANRVVVVTDRSFIHHGYRVTRVFETDPATGTVFWRVELWGDTVVNMNLQGRAITKDSNGDYYVLSARSDAQGMNGYPYVAKINSAGTVLWQNFYITTAKDHIDPVDLLYDPVMNEIVFAANYDSIGQPAGVLAVRITPATGAVVGASHFRTITNVPDMELKDIDRLANGNFAMVGAVNYFPKRPFMIQYSPGLTPVVPFSTLYSASPAAIGDVFMTGVKPSGGAGAMVVSFDRTTHAGRKPGMVELNASGNYIAPALSYDVSDYTGSRGLILLGDSTSAIVKGGTGNATFSGRPSLSLVADSLPLVLGASVVICDSSFAYRHSNQETPVDFTITADPTQGEVDVNFTVKSLHGEIYNCLQNQIGSFRLASPTGIETWSNPMQSVSIRTRPMDS